MKLGWRCLLISPTPPKRKPTQVSCKSKINTYFFRPSSTEKFTQQCKCKSWCLSTRGWLQFLTSSPITAKSFPFPAEWSDIFVVYLKLLAKREESKFTSLTIVEQILWSASRNQLTYDRHALPKGWFCNSQREQGAFAWNSGRFAGYELDSLLVWWQRYISVFIKWNVTWNSVA